MSLRGLPDFHQPLESPEGVRIFYPYEGGNFIVVPDGLDISTRSNGRIDFTLEQVRKGQSAYGVLDFKVHPSFRMNHALTFLRTKHADASLNRALFRGGFMRFVAAGVDVELPQDLTTPVHMGWHDIGSGRLTIRLSSKTATKLRDALIGEMLLVTAVGEMLILGVASRTRVRVRFNPARLLKELLAISDQDRRISIDKLSGFFRRDQTALPLEITGDIDGQRLDNFVDAVTDRVRHLFGKATAAPVEPVTPHLRLVDPDSVGSGILEWNLLDPVIVERTFTLKLDPLNDARAMIRSHGMGSILRQTTVPPIPLGVYTVEMQVNLPAERPGVLAMGINLHVPPCAPQRPQPVAATVQFKSPDTSAIATLRLAPLEKLSYTYTTFVILQQGNSIKSLEGQPRLSESDFLSLNQDDFPVNFISVEADQSLLDVATIFGVCIWFDGVARREQKFEIDSARPVVMPAIPKGISGAVVEITAVERNGNGVLKLGPFSAASLQLGLFSFPQWGPHKIEIECVFSNTAETCVIELAPAERQGASNEITLLSLSLDEPRKEWSWFAESPFYPGFCYRPRRNRRESAAPWIDVPIPSDSLKINSEIGEIK